MAQRVTVSMTDDLDGSEATETVRFGLDGNAYEIDLNATNAGQLRADLGPYAQAARRASTGRRGTATPARNAQSRHHSRDVRTWAADNGISINARGRIPVDVERQYQDAQRAPAPPPAPAPAPALASSPGPARGGRGAARGRASRSRSA